MGRQRLTVWLGVLVLAASAAASAQYNCVPVANPPKLPMVRASGALFQRTARIVQLAGISDSWKSTRREVGSVRAGAMVEVLEDVALINIL